MFATTSTIKDTTSLTHSTRLECRQGLRIFQQKFPSSQLITQQFDTNVSDEINEKKNSNWDGATKEGTTTIRSGPDYNKVNATLILPDGSDLAVKEKVARWRISPSPTPYQSIF